MYVSSLTFSTGFPLLPQRPEDGASAAQQRGRRRDGPGQAAQLSALRHLASQVTTVHQILT